HALAPQHASEFQKIAGLAAGARADVRAVQFDVAELLGQLASARIGMAGDRRFELGNIRGQLVNELLLTLTLDWLVGSPGAIELASACVYEDAGAGIAEAGGKLVEGPRHARVRIGAERNLAGARMALLRQRGMAHASVIRAVLALEHSFTRVEMPMPIRVVNHIVKISNALLFDKIAQDIHVAVGLGIRSENVVVGHDNNFVSVPDLGLVAELAFEHANGAPPAHIVGHQNVGLDPNIVSRLNAGLAGG